MNYQQIIFAYLRHNMVILLAGGYFVFSSVLKLLTSIDICIPCLWRTVLGVRCPGCGLTTAFIHLLKFDFIGAYRSNWMIFLIVPAVGFYFIKDFLKFQSRYISS